MMSSKKTTVLRTVFSAMFLALALVLPFVTAGIPQIGAALCPMHLPVLLCGFFCGPYYGLLVGAVAPLLRLLMFGMPTLMPTGIGMCFELAAYGFFSGLFYRLLPKKKPFVYVSLLGAMVIGRVVWGVVRTVLFSLTDTAFTWKMFIAGAVVNAVPGIILQIVLVPILVMALKKYTAVTDDLFSVAKRADGKQNHI